MPNKPGQKSFHIYSCGCKTNQCESDEILCRLAEKGYFPVELAARPDIIIINTCTVTSAAAKKVRQYLRKSRASNPCSKIIVTGCHAVFNSEELKKLGADLIIQNDEKGKIPGIIDFQNHRQESGKNSISLPRRQAGVLPQNINLLPARSRALVKIQDGCQQDCRYCIVPLARGKYRSAGPDEVISKVNYFTEKNYDEVVFTGIHIGKYGIDFAGMHKELPALSLAGLLCKTLENTKVKRIRLSSIEINEIDNHLIKILQYSGGRIAPHLHIPLQSGSERILKAMNRHYTCSFFLEMVEKLKESIPGLVLTTDIIVGFPTEKEDDFNDTLYAVKKADFKKTHVFKYSRRPLTGAYSMEGQVDEKAKSRRSSIAREITDKMRDLYIGNLTGCRLDVVCEKYDSISGIASGTSENYVRVYFNIGREDFSKNKCRIIGVRAQKKYRDGLYGLYLKA
ncbi:MAG: tRNA (N(6)-L-threonylcarbamoyladenosine(37)-C(2))-methylthiotransferase MtaB [Actinobacteria bacterium]|nr:tRNA (N(6)-L-threonylcarbamoyladenosine(37)-C(2))-methylthiotransferase MtaB [Actinomycetota bacterium]